MEHGEGQSGFVEIRAFNKKDTTRCKRCCGKFMKTFFRPSTWYPHLPKKSSPATTPSARAGLKTCCIELGAIETSKQTKIWITSMLSSTREGMKGCYISVTLDFSKSVRNICVCSWHLLHNSDPQKQLCSNPIRHTSSRIFLSRVLSQLRL